MKSQDLKKLTQHQSKHSARQELPDAPGVYIFKYGREILYIGKATSLRDRVQSYFSSDLVKSRGMLLVDMITKANKVDFVKTDSVLEALILEAELIKKHQPKYNTKEKDNKSFNYVCITRDEIPKVLIVRGRVLKKLTADSFKLKAIFGPFTSGTQLREALKIIRRIFPFFDMQSIKKQNTEFYKQLGLVPDLKSPQKSPRSQEQTHQNLNRVGAPAERVKRANSGVFADGGKEYKNNIKNLILFFQGKKKKILQNLKKEMGEYAKRHEFEKANEIKKRIFALNHINDVALIREDRFNFSPPAKGEMPKGRGGRIEAYDVAHMAGKNMVGVMTVVEDGEPEKSEYKKFIIKTVRNANDPASLREILERRLAHKDWPYPDLIVVDGNNIQKNVAQKVLKDFNLKIPIMAVTKNERHKPKAIIGTKILIEKYKKDILLANSEAHRFAISYYRQKSRKNMLK